MRETFNRRAALSVVWIVVVAVVMAACAQREEPGAREAFEPTPSLLVSRETGTPNPPETWTIQSRLLEEQRRVYVQLPEGYERSGARYPVLVVLDGEWLFELARANVRFLSEYEVMDVAIPRMIVVGIENVDRDRDYVPTEDPQHPPRFDTAGKADVFLRFLDEELLPLIDSRLRTAPSRAVAGWSFGGLAAMYSAVAMPRLFDAYLCIGPAIWWDDDLVGEMVRKARFDPPKRMVITLGSLEEGSWVHTSTTRLLKLLDEKPVPGLEVDSLLLDEVGHSWGVPPALDRGLRHLFSGYIAPNEVSTSSIDEVEAYYKELSFEWRFEVAPPIPVMQGLAMHLHAEGDPEGAMMVLERLVTYEPDAALAYFYLGKYSSGQKNHESALRWYRQALAAELRRDVPKEIFLQPYRRSVAKAEAAVGESEE